MSKLRKVREELRKSQKRGKSLFLKVCSLLWKLQFEKEFAGPDKGATCEYCLLYKNEACIDWIPPEECIEDRAKHILLEGMEDNQF